jgi:type I restriction enzyme M protein
MTPKGGIKPHNKFGVASNRAEVLFVDYIINHLKPKGRAGIVVPEGIIFQSGRAYKELRRNLVENGLFAVVSLPGGVFQPYSGVKTSILLLNNELAKQKSEIAFIKISADGFDLGASKRVVSQNDLPMAVELLNNWSKGLLVDNSLFSVVEKDVIASNGNYVLSGESYKAGVDHSMANWPIVELGEITEILDSKRKPITKSDRTKGPYPYYGATGIVDYVNDYIFDERLLLLGEDGAKWGAGEASAFIVEGKCWVNNHAHVLRPDKTKVIDTYLVHLLNYLDLSQHITGVTVPKLNQEKMRGITVPLPPLEVQAEMVAELDGYAAIISGAKQIVGNWKPRIVVAPEWEKRELGDICDVYQPKTITGAEILDDGPFKVYGANGVIGFYDKFNHPEAEVAVTCRGATCGTVNFTEPESWITGNAMVVSPKDKTISKKFLQYLLISTDLNPVITGSAQPQITGASLKPFEIHVPPIDVQEVIIELIDKEASLVNSAKQLIELYERRTKFVIEKLWSSVEESQ